MTRVFKAYTDILPPAQKRLWGRLGGLRGLGFTLYGGTAIDLRLGHRESIDFDFFTERPLDQKAIRDAMPFMARGVTIQDRKDSWTMLLPDGESGAQSVKLSLFGDIDFGRVGEPELTSDGVLLVASLEDLMAAKLKVILRRAESKDYRDIAAMLDAGVDLASGLASARALFGPNFQPNESLKALTYFKDGDLATLPAEDRTALARAAQAVRRLPVVAIRSMSLGIDSDASGSK